MEKIFFDRPHMAASKYKTEDNEVATKVSVLMPEDILNWHQPPYDLLKCDIEGAEWEVFEHYSEILKSTKFILVEWHQGKGSYEDFLRESEIHDLELIKTEKKSSEELTNRDSYLLLLQK